MINMKAIVKPELVFWFDAPPRASAGVFRFVAQEWGNNVYYICCRNLRQERLAGGWQDCNHGKALVTILEEKSDPDRFVRDFIQQHSDAIHICNGLRSMTSTYIKKHLLSDLGGTIALWSERPGVFGGRVQQYIRKIGLPVLYRYYALRYGRKIGVYLCLGTRGVETFARFGWKREILFPFMYCPEVTENQIMPTLSADDKKLRFIYIGRFSKATKGIDVLMQAFDRITGDNWRLDLVGGYGADKDETIAWAQKHPNVSFRGTWPSSEICQRITQYDVCVIPSRFDGWNVVTNEALCAGVGIIITDAAVSDDLVRASGAGIVVPSGDVHSLQKAIQMVIDSPDLAESWKYRARSYSPRIKPDQVGHYLMDVLEYTFLNRTLPRPECPWL